MKKENILNYFSGNFKPFFEKFLQNIKPIGGDEYQALCPFHEDANPSLSVNVKTGRYFCHGCGMKGDVFHFYAKINSLNTRRDFGKILKGIADDFGIGFEQQKPKLIKAYSYYDRNNKLLFQVCRFEPKDFRQRRPWKNGWVWNLNGIDPILYRLPEVLKADEVIIVEGEKDADNLSEIGFTATTSPMGARKWKESYIEFLKGKNIVLIADDDNEGHEHMTRVAQSLNGNVKSIKWIDLPNLPSKGDVSDFIAKFKDKEQAAERLSILIDNAEPYEPPAKIDSEKAQIEVTTRYLREYIESLQCGIFTTRDVCSDLGIHDQKGKAIIRTLLNRLCSDDVIESVKGFAGTWRKPEKKLEKMDLSIIEYKPVNLRLPFDLHTLVHTLPGNIIVLTGDADAGKTAFLLNTAKENLDRFKIHYFSSEMGPQEMRLRLDKFDGFPVTHKNFSVYERSDDFEDVIKSGKNHINIIDYLELNENFFRVSLHLKNIHDRLKDAIAIIAIQKKDPKCDDPLGGKRALEKPRLALSMSNGRIKIIKAKNWATQDNPNGMIFKFKLVNGCKFLRLN